MFQPLLLLDVDGPLNPFAAKPTRRPAGYTTHRLRPHGWAHAEKPLRVWLSPAHGQMLLDIAATHGVELAWATTWQHQANTMIGPILGLPELPVIEFDSHPHTLKGWKFPAVADYSAGRPLIWFDDDFGEPRFVHAMAEFQSRRESIPTLLYHIDPGIGLTQSDLDVVGEWLSSDLVFAFRAA